MGQSGRHNTDTGRHRLAPGAIRLVEDGAGGWSLTPVRPTSHIGRVGALAVFLGVGVSMGVGGAITGLPAVAVADTGAAEDTTAETATAQTATAHTATAQTATAQTAADPGPAAPGRKSRGARAGSADITATDSPAPSSHGRTGRSSTTLAGTGAHGAAVSDRPGSAQRPVTPRPVAGVADARTHPTADRASTNSFVVSQDSVSIPEVDSQVRTPAAAESVAQITPAASSSATAPVMVAAISRGAVTGAGGNPRTWLGGNTDPLAPIAAPIAWAALAVSRRELFSTAIVAAPAASVATGEPAASGLAAMLGQPGAAPALVAAAKQFVLAMAGGGDIAAALDRGLASLDANPLFQNFSLNLLTADPAMPQAVGGAITAIVTGLAADSEVQAALGDRLAGYLTSALGNDPVAVGIAGTVADAVVSLLADPAGGAGLGSVAGTAVTVFLSQRGVVAAGADVVDQIAAVVAGGDPADALDTAWLTLRADPAIRDAVGVAVTEAVNAALTDSGLVRALGATATVLVTGLTANPAAWTFIDDLVGPTYGTAIVGMLADPAASGRLAELAGQVVTGFLGAPGVVAALSNSANQITTAVLVGATTSGVLQSALASLQADPAISAALDGIVSTALRSILGESAVQETIGAVVRDAVVTLISGSADTSALGSTALGSTAGRAAEAAVDSLLANTAVQNLIGDLAVEIAGGTPVNALTNAVIQAVISGPALQAAVGAAVGQAVGSLFGDNLVGVVVSQVVGTAATLLIGVASGIASLLNFFGFAVPGAAAAADDSLRADSYLFEWGRLEALLT